MPDPDRRLRRLWFLGGCRAPLGVNVPFDVRRFCPIHLLREGRVPNGEAAWELFVAGYGPTKMLAEGLDAPRREQFKADFVAFTNNIGANSVSQCRVTIWSRLDGGDRLAQLD